MVNKLVKPTKENEHWQHTLEGDGYMALKAHRSCLELLVNCLVY